MVNIFFSFLHDLNIAFLSILIVRIFVFVGVTAGANSVGIHRRLLEALERREGRAASRWPFLGY